MTSVSLQRNVLVLTDTISIRNLFYLMGKLDSENAAEGSGNAMAAIAERECYDTIILVMRCSDGRSGRDVHGISKVHSSRVGRTQTVTVEANGPETVALVERYLLSGLPGALLWLVSHRYKSPRQLRPL
jgi:hypothetical protein